MSELTQGDVRVLQEALDDEYRAWSTYDQVIADFGAVAPFFNIRASEARHIDALCRLFERHGLSPPANPWPGRVDRFASVQDACDAGVTAEVANGAMYDRLLSTTQNPEILAVLRRLQEASAQRHLPAFERCSESGGGSSGGGCVGGRRRRRGRAGCA